MSWEHLAAPVSRKNKGSWWAWTFTKTTFINTGLQGCEVREGPSPSPTCLAWAPAGRGTTRGDAHDAEARSRAFPRPRRCGSFRVSRWS